MAAYLALLLFSPWFAILGWAYWKYPRRQVAAGNTRRFDAGVLLAAVLLSAAAMRWTYGMHFQHAGTMWPQVMATLAGYHAFLAVLVAAWLLRGRLYAGKGGS
jgi:hypothetical protein